MSWARAVVHALDARGVDGKALAARAGLDPEAFADPDARTPIVATGRLWRLAVEATEDPCFGLFASRFVSFATFQALGFALLASISVKDAFHRLVRYSRVVSDAADYRLEEAGDRYRLVVEVAPTARLEHESLDALVSLKARTVRALYDDRSISPLAVTLVRPEPPLTEPFRRFFRAPVEFAARANVLEFAREVVEARLPSGNAELARRSDEVLAHYLARVDAGNVLSRVRSLIVERLPDGEPPEESVARALGVSLRTLQRRLAEEGTSYGEVLRCTRRDLACAYLSESGWSITEIAFSLGFADMSSFSRAFRRWTGTSPSEYAASLARAV